MCVGRTFLYLGAREEMLDVLQCLTTPSSSNNIAKRVMTTEYDSFITIGTQCDALEYPQFHANTEDKASPIEHESSAYTTA